MASGLQQYCTKVPNALAVMAKVSEKSYPFIAALLRYASNDARIVQS